MGRIYNNIVETVGRTPLVRLNRVTQGLSATVLLKCEFFNPLGSVKDRIGMSMIDDAERYQAVDQDRRNAIEAANRADSVVNDTEKALKEHEDKLDKAEADTIKEKITALRELVAKAQSGEGSITSEELKTKTDAVQTASLTLFDKIHRTRHEQQEAPPTSEQGSQGPEGEKKE